MPLNTGDDAEKAKKRGESIAKESYIYLACYNDEHEKVAYKQQDPIPKAIASILISLTSVFLSKNAGTFIIKKYFKFI